MCPVAWSAHTCVMSFSEWTMTGKVISIEESGNKVNIE